MGFLSHFSFELLCLHFFYTCISEYILPLFVSMYVLNHVSKVWNSVKEKNIENNKGLPTEWICKLKCNLKFDFFVKTPQTILHIIDECILVCNLTKPFYFGIVRHDCVICYSFTIFFANQTITYNNFMRKLNFQTDQLIQMVFDLIKLISFFQIHNKCSNSME